MTNFPISLIHPTGNPFSREAALALAEAGLLHEIITTIAYDPASPRWRFLHRLPTGIGNKLRSELGRRTWIPPVPIKTHPWKEAIRIALMRTGLGRSLGFTHQNLADWIYASLDQHVAKNHCHWHCQQDGEIPGCFDLAAIDI